MRLAFPIFACVAVAIASCSLSLGRPPTPSVPVSPPTPTLRPAPAYVDGHAASPEGKYLFVEYSVVHGGTSARSQCPSAAMIDFPGYSYSEGVLNVYVAPLPGDQGLIGYAGYGEANTGAMGGGVSSRLEVISALPFSLPYSTATLHALEVTGEIVVEIQGATYLMAPGESWTRMEEWDPTADCHRTTVTRFTNFGLLDRTQIRSFS